jgi:acyl-coenzyme A thioesterase PaaI-like protein
MTGERPIDDGRCFACGPYADDGLRMRFEETGVDAVACEVTLPERFQGWRGVAHGGVVAMLLDEGMAYAAATRGHLGMTAELKLRFRAPVPLGAPLVVRGRVEWQRRNVCGVSAEIADASGAVLAAGEGRFVVKGALAPGERLGRFGDGG